jgi:acylphosphatase
MATRLMISGRVQGVGYRQWMQAEAQRLGLAGWVRNRHDGSVEAVVDGPAHTVGELIEAARTGPPAARVDAIETEQTEGGFSGFEWRPTA